MNERYFFQKVSYEEGVIVIQVIDSETNEVIQLSGNATRIWEYIKKIK